MWYIHAIELYSAIKRNDILIHATIWMNFKNIILLRERSQINKTTWCIISFTQNAREKKSIETERRLVFAKGWGKGK